MKMNIPLLGIGVALSLAWTSALHAQTPTRPTFIVDIKVGTNAFAPMGAGQPRDNVPNASRDRDTRTLNIYTTNVSGKELTNVKIIHAMYKLDSNGNVRQMAKGEEKPVYKPQEKRLTTASGQLSLGSGSTTRIEDFYGWYVKIVSDGATVYEKWTPQGLKETEEFKKNFPPPRKK